jgi:hypothetical protein
MTRHESWPCAMKPAVVEAEEIDMRVGDRGSVHVYEAGEPHGQVVIYHHGTPLAGLLPGTWHRAAVAAGFRWVSFDRSISTPADTRRFTPTRAPIRRPR